MVRGRIGPGAPIGENSYRARRRRAPSSNGPDSGSARRSDLGHEQVVHYMLRSTARLALAFSEKGMRGVAGRSRVPPASEPIRRRKYNERSVSTKRRKYQPHWYSDLSRPASWDAWEQSSPC